MAPLWSDRKDYRRFANRHEAGVALARALAAYGGRPDVVVLGLPRGGVPVAYEIARALRAPLDVFVVRKLGVPGYRELAMGAIASGDIHVLDASLIQSLDIPQAAIAAVVEDETRELRRRELLYRGQRPGVPLAGRTVILADDGLATGSTMLAAVRGVRRAAPARVIVAVPVGARQACARIQDEADDVICLRSPEPFDAVGLWYLDFSETSDQEVRLLLEEPAQVGSTREE
jgi:predicted phosphoribosyltransferase